jgi:CubicO group peptidase (beta-lactamase class C family)
MSIFREDGIGPREAYHDLDSAGYQAAFNSRSFTWAEPSYPLTISESLFRIAGMSKPITTITIFRLVEQGSSTASLCALQSLPG